MSICQKNISLIDYLAERMRCRYLSDLKLRPWRPNLSGIVEDIPVDGFSHAQWLDALRYLSGLNPEAELLSGELKGLLVDWLRRDERTSFL